MKPRIQLLIFIILVSGLAYAQTPEQLFKAAGSPVNPKVPISWNRYNDHAGIAEICKKIAAVHNANIQLSDNLPHGAIFSIHFPA